MSRKTNDMDYREICQQIQEERPEGFRVNSITVNFDKLGYEIQSNVLDRICDRLQNQAEYYLNDEITIIRDNSLNELWTYSIRHNCGRSPMYDEEQSEHYCPHCEQQSIFNY